MSGGFHGVWDDGLIVEEDARWRITDIRVVCRSCSCSGILDKRRYNTLVIPQISSRIYCGYKQRVCDDTTYISSPFMSYLTANKTQMYANNIAEPYESPRSYYSNPVPYSKMPCCIRVRDRRQEFGSQSRSTRRRSQIQRPYNCKIVTGASRSFLKL